MTTTLNEARKSLHTSKAHTKFHLFLWGEEEAGRRGWRGLDGWEAVQLYLQKEHGLMPAQIQAMDADYVRFLLTEELTGWTIPQKYCGTPPSEISLKNDVAWSFLRQCLAEVPLNQITEELGDWLGEAKNLGDLDGREALEVYLCRVHGYTPSQVSEWSYETIRVLLERECAERRNQE